MKYLKRYNESLDNEEIHSICKKYGIKNYTINSDGSIDVDGSVALSKKGLTKLPLRFRNVRNFFTCYNNQLRSLEGAPESVGGDFWCFNNNLTSLEGAPKNVGGNFNCINNKLISLEGAPESVGYDFDCNSNDLVNLIGAPKSIGRNFNCEDNNIMSLDGLEFKSFENIILKGNPIYSIVKDWINREDREVLIEYFVDMGIVQGTTLIKDRLIQFYDEIGLFDSAYDIK